MALSFSWSKAGDQRSNALNATPQQKLEADQMVPIVDQLQRVKDAWDPQNPNCVFQHYFYNQVPQDQVMLYAMPPGQDQAKWEQAIAKRPDQSSVPVLAVGFDDLNKRLSQQKQQVDAYKVRMKEVRDKLSELSNRHDLHTAVKLAEMRARHAKLVRKTLALAIKLQVVTNRGHVLTPEEERLRQKLKELLARAEDPSVFGSLNEVWARVRVIKDRSEAKDQSTDGDGGHHAHLDLERNKEQIERTIKVLAAQQTGIKFLAGLIEEDKERVEKTLVKNTDPASESGKSTDAPNTGRWHINATTHF